MNIENMPNPKVDVERVNEIKKASFWVSQIFIIIATVIGVFLAATQGYKQAVQFENMTSYKESYYLQKSLQYELEDNIAILKSYMKDINDPTIYGALDRPMAFYNLIWENMKFSSTTLATPPELLRDAQRFYRQVNDIHTSLTKSNRISISYATKQFQEQIDLVEQNLIPALKNSTDKIKQELDGSDVIL